MGSIGQNLQLPSDGSEILCAIRAPHKTYAYQILWQNMSYFASYGEKWACQTLQIWVYAHTKDTQLLNGHGEVNAQTKYMVHN